MPWGLFVLGAAAFYVLVRLLRLQAPTVGALTLLGGFGNTSFVGLPMIESLYGRDGLGRGPLIDQLGSHLALSTLGLLATAIYSTGGRSHFAKFAWRCLSNMKSVKLVSSAGPDLVHFHRTCPHSGAPPLTCQLYIAMLGKS